MDLRTEAHAILDQVSDYLLPDVIDYLKNRSSNYLALPTEIRQRVLSNLHGTDLYTSTDRSYIS